MASIGGPVGAMPPNTANHANQDHSDYVKRLNTYIYDYFVRNQHYECARSMLLNDSLPLELHSKTSLESRQANGVDDMDTDSKDRPKDLPRAELPAGSGDFLEDWWTQFWDVFNSRRTGSGKQPTLSYISQQRQMQKARSGMMGNDAAARGNFNMMNGGAPGGPDNLKKAAMMNNGQMHPQMQAMARVRAQAQAQQQQQMLQAGQMERQGSQMDNRSGSPGSGGAPSPKRARTDGNGQMLRGAQSPGQGGHMQNQSLESYNAQIQQSMKSAMNQAQANSNMIKGMPPNAAQAAAFQAQAQGSPMPQASIDMAELAAANGLRAGMIPPNGINGGAQGQLNGGSHALQDYQMQLMLLEQQNKRRLLMAKGEQDSMSGNNGMPTPNGQFPHSMSPSGRGNSSPNPNDMARGTPNMLNGGPSPNMAGRGSPGPNFDPNAMRAQLMVGPNGQTIPRSMPMQGNQIDMIRAQQMMQGAGFPNGPGMPPNGMMAGGVPPNMTPRQQNQMPPPPAPQPNAAGTQPSSPAPVAPPTPNQSAKSKAANKKDTKAKQNSNKKNANAAAAAAAAAAATPASEAEQPPTPSPATPMTNAKSFQQNQAVMAGMSGGAPGPGQGMQQGVMQPGQELGVPFNMDASEQFNMINDFTMDNPHGDVLDNFDFDAFLQNTDQDGAIGSFDTFDFSNVGGVEAADGLGQ